MLPNVEEYHNLPSALEYRERIMETPELYTTGGELFSWHACNKAGGFVTGYEVTREKQWIEEGIQYFDWLVSKMDIDPDGYSGWVGPHIDVDKYIGSESVGDANLIAPMLKMAELILKDEGLADIYGGKAWNYVEVGKHIIEKYDARETWFEYGQFGQYIYNNRWTMAETGEWLTVTEILEREEKPIWYLNSTVNLNKSAKMGLVCLMLYRILKEPFYKDRAEKVFGHYKHIMRYFEEENRYVWNFWEPFGPWDMDLLPRGWVNVHPYRPGYQAGEVEMMVEAYHTGVVFDQEDIQRIINTNLWMWNKSLGDPQFISADGKNDAGCLWIALMDFDDTIRSIYESQLERSDTNRRSLYHEYYKKITKQIPPTFERRYVKGEVQLPSIPIYPSRSISMAVATPPFIKLNSLEDTMTLCAQVRSKGGINVDLYNEAGEDLITHLGDKVIGEIGVPTADDLEKSDYLAFHWDGRDMEGNPLPVGTYIVRWTMGDSRREQEIKILR